jgi:GntR family transcriptional regulator
MILIDPQSPVPINDQIKAGLRGLTARGALRPGDAVPSIRALAEQLLVNPNTIARAYRELAHEGFLESRRGEGNFVAEKVARSLKDGLAEARVRLQDALIQARRAGLEWKDIMAEIHAARGEKS